MEPTHKTLLTLAGIGLFVGIGRILLEEDKLNWKLVVGRCIASVAIGLSAGFGLALIPGMSDVALYGLAAGLSSLGTSAVERFLQIKASK